MYVVLDAGKVVMGDADMYGVDASKVVMGVADMYGVLDAGCYGGC